MLKNKSKILIFSLVILLFPMITRGADLILDCYEKGNCGICDALKLATKIANYIIGLSGVAALVMFLFAGLTLITSQGNSGKLTSAKKIMTNTVIGMFVIYIAWVGVNYVIYSFTDSKNSKGVATVFSKSWQDFSCVKTPEKPIEWTNKPPVSVPPGGNLVDLKNPPESCQQSKNYAGGYSPFSFYGIKPEQKNDISKELEKTLRCMYDMLQAGAGGLALRPSDIHITSISDDAGIGNCIPSKWTDPICAHEEKSCHYGGSNPSDPPKSYAADIDNLDATRDAMIMELIVKAGGAYIDETKKAQSHIHMSVSPCSGL